MKKTINYYQFLVYLKGNSVPFNVSTHDDFTSSSVLRDSIDVEFIEFDNLITIRSSEIAAVELLKFEEQFLTDDLLKPNRSSNTSVRGSNR